MMNELSELADQIADQALFILNYDETFNSIIINEIKSEKDTLSKISKLFHIFIERLAVQDIDMKKAIKLNKYQKFIEKIQQNFASAPKNKDDVLKWIISSLYKKTDRKNLNLKDNEKEKLKKEIESLQKKSLIFSQSIQKIKNSYESNLNHTQMKYQNEIFSLKQKNKELIQYNKELKSKLKTIKTKNNNIPSQENINKFNDIGINTNEPNIRNNYDDKEEILLSEIRALRNDKQKLESEVAINLQKLEGIERDFDQEKIQNDMLKAKLNDQINLSKSKEDELQKAKAEAEKFLEQCIRLETEMAKLRDKTNIFYVNNENYSEKINTSCFNNISKAIEPGFSLYA